MYNIAKASEQDRRVLFRNTAQQTGLHEAIIEKDFWVCLTLDHLFHHSPWKAAFTFKGGTSLSKCYGLIQRFSEDIDLILDSFRPVTADVDEVKFTLAISNLVENGIKYNVDEGWVRVTLDADHKDFYVTVADSGLGIPEDSIERIFERFFLFYKSHSREIGGTGLGLAITRSSIAMHHGIIKVSSKEGEGTTFTVKIPLSYIPS